MTVRITHNFNHNGKDYAVGEHVKNAKLEKIFLDEGVAEKLVEKQAEK